MKFELSFKLARGRTEGLGKPLEFRAHVNSTSEETDLSNNFWDAIVRVIKRAELELTGVSEPPIVRFVFIANRKIADWSIKLVVN